MKQKLNQGISEKISLFFMGHTLFSGADEVVAFEQLAPSAAEIDIR